LGAGVEHEHEHDEARAGGKAEIDALRCDLFIRPLPNEIRFFSREWCSWCIDAKAYLIERGYEFTEIDVGRDRVAYEEMKELSDQTCVPTLVAGDEVLANFSTDQLEKFLRRHAIVP
jgi:glutaredoxin